jgi:molybdate transport system substrate-binding protein
MVRKNCAKLRISRSYLDDLLSLVMIFADISRMKRIIAVVAAVLFATSISAAGAADNVTLAALSASAASDAMNEIIALYERSHPGVKIQPTYGGAVILAALVESGSGDLILIGTSTIEALHSHNKIGTPTPIASLHEAVLVLKGSTKVRGLRDLANPGVHLAMGTANSTLIKYAHGVLEKASAKFGPDFERKVMANVVTTKTSGAQIVAAVKSGAVDAAIGFSVDSSDAIEAIPIPAEDDVFTTNLAAVVTGSSHEAVAQAFIDFMHGAEAQAIFRKHHFDAPR